MSVVPSLVPTSPDCLENAQLLLDRNPLPFLTLLFLYY